MQQYLQTAAGSGALRALPPQHGSGPAQPADQRHRALLLLGDARPRRSAVWRRAIDRLMAPAAQVEGVDFHLSNPALAAMAADAAAFVLVLPPVGNLSNPYYSVHPRRNDRFVTARAPLKALFPEVDFTSFSFTGHMLATLAAVCPQRHARLRQTLASVWALRMTTLIERLPRRGVLLDLPPPPWAPRPPIPGEERRRLVIDPDDRQRAAHELAVRLGGA